MSRLEVLFLVASLGSVATVVEALRRRRLAESFALAWVGLALSLLFLSVGRPVIDRIATAVGVSYGANLLLGIGVLVLLLLSLSQAMHITRIEERVEVLAQELALLHGVREPAPAPADDDVEASAERDEHGGGAERRGGAQPDQDDRPDPG